VSFAFMFDEVFELRAGGDARFVYDVLVCDGQVAPALDFAGCVPGVNEVLRQQGLLGSARCLSSGERLSPGQQDAITAVRSRFPRLLDEEFVADNKHLWLQ